MDPRNQDTSDPASVAATRGVRRGDWMQTFTGRQFWPMDPLPWEIDITDIAHALAMQCRFAGHCLRFYSVAEHSVLLARAVAPEHALWALLHDASEAYLVDVPRPVKPFLAGYKDAERAVMLAVCNRFRLGGDMPDEVKIADGRILADEAAQNMATPPTPWNDTGAPLGVELQFWTPERAKEEFLVEFLRLTLGASSRATAERDRGEIAALEDVKLRPEIIRQMRRDVAALRIAASPGALLTAATDVAADRLEIAIQGWRPDEAVEP